MQCHRCHYHDILAQACMLECCFELILKNPYHTEAASLVGSCWCEVTRPVGVMKFCYCDGEMTPPSPHGSGQCLRDDCPRAPCHTEVTSLAKPYRSAATIPVRSRWPEATRPVGERQSCFCGGKCDRAQCQRDDCPRARLGYGSCHMALSKLWSMAGSSSGRNLVKPKPIAVDSGGDWYRTIAEIRTEIRSENRKVFPRVLACVVMVGRRRVEKSLYNSKWCSSEE